MTDSLEAKILGLAVKALMEGLTEEKSPLLDKYGFGGEIDESAWYLRKDYLAMVNELAESARIVDMVAIGLQVSRYVPMPPAIDSIESALQNLDVSYHVSHRNIAKDEGWKYQKIDERTHYLVSCNPYPANIGYGIVFGLIERFAPPDTRFSVFMEEEGGYPAYRVVLR
jgi:hypothetical protein